MPRPRPGLPLRAGRTGLPSHRPSADPPGTGHVLRRRTISGSPKYSQVARAAARRAAEEAARRRAAERRARAAALRADKDRSRTRRLADQERESARLREQRIAERGRIAALAEQEAATRAAHLRAAAVGEAATAGVAVTLRTETVSALQAKLKAVADTELLGATKASKESQAAVDALRTEQGRCAELLRDLTAAVPQEDGGVRFESLLGTVERAIERFQHGILKAEESRDADLRALTEARERFAEIKAVAEVAAQEAPEADLPELAGVLEAALAQTRRAVAAGPGVRALAAMAELERITADAEARLDEAVIVAERRGHLAEALKEAMAAQGMSCQGGEREAGRIVLHFTRPNGASYTAQITDHPESGESLLTYTVDGESDIAASAVVDGAVCDRTEALLESVHEALAPHGFEAGETVWVGKPRRPAGPPRHGSGRTLPASGGANSPQRARGGGEGAA